MPEIEQEILTKLEFDSDILKELLRAYTTPSFGTLPKREIDLMFLDALIKTGDLDSEPKIYDLISRLKVTRSKARTLVYERELRRLADSDLKILVKESIINATPHKDGDLYVIEIENPYALDHLKHLVQKTGHAADGSFSSSIVRLSLKAYMDLIPEILSKKEVKAADAKLVKAGAPDKSFKGILKGLASKILGNIGDLAVDESVDFLTNEYKELKSSIGNLRDLFNGTDSDINKIICSLSATLHNKIDKKAEKAEKVIAAQSTN